MLNPFPSNISLKWRRRSLLSPLKYFLSFLPSLISPSKIGLTWFHYLLRNAIIRTLDLKKSHFLEIFSFVLVVCFGFFLLMKLILTGHCSLVANSLPDFPLPVKLAHNHKQNGERGSISTVRAAELHCWGRSGMTSL